jgi:large repetitive protein
MKKKLHTINLNFMLLAVGLLMIISAVAQNPITLTTSPFVVPAGVSQIKVEVWGGGGGGGGVSTGAFGTNTGSGGGGGAYNTVILPVSEGQSYTFTIGSGGPGGAGNTTGTTGGITTFSGIGGSVSANGGIGGAGNAGTAGVGATGGVFNGGAGTINGAGGGGAGNNGNGQNANTFTGGAGGAGTIPGGVGGAGRTNTGNGNGGAAPSGGGGGAARLFSGGTGTGGTGGAGRVVVTYCPTYTLLTTVAQSPKCAVPGNSIVTVTSPNLPVGTYNILYNRTLPNAVSLAATLNVATANTGTFTVGGLTTPGSSTITITSIASAANSFCTNSVSENNTATIEVEPIATVFAGDDQVVCAGTQILLHGELGGSAGSFTWSGAGEFLPNNTDADVVYVPTPAEITAGFATVTLTTDDPAGDCGPAADQMVVTLQSTPTAVSITPASNSICVGTGIALTGNATVAVSPPLTSENFNTAVGSFTTAGSSSGSGTNTGQPSITNNDGNTAFMIATAAGALSGTSSTNSTLTTPVLNTIGYGNLSLTFRHTYKKGQEAGVSVQVSTDGGGSWSNVSTAGAVIGTNTYTANQGANNSFLAVNINLGAFTGQANFRIRFNFVSNVAGPAFGVASSWWAIDAVALNGNKVPLYSWSSDGPGLPIGANTLNINNKNITAFPTNNPTTYTLTASDPFTNCTTTSSLPVEISIIPNSTLAQTSLPGLEIQDVCPNVAIEDIVYAVGGSATNAVATGLPIGVAGTYNEGVFSISGTPSIAGSYPFTVTTVGPCEEESLTGTLVVNTPPVNSFIKTNVSVCNTNDGSITMTPVGTGPYSYAWSGVTGSGNPASTPYPNPGDVAAISNLPIGFYNVTVTDGNGCFTATTGIQVKYAFAPYVTNNGSNSASCVNTGSIILYANAGVTPYTYALDAGTFQTSNTFTDLAPGIYQGHVKDAAGCISTKEITIGTNGPIAVNPISRNASSCAPDGSIEIYRTGGIPPYTYNLDGGPNQASNKFLNLAAGNYTCNVTDSKGCTGSAVISVGQGIGLTVSANKTNSSNCTTDGTIQVIVSGGVAPYTYSTDGVNFQVSNSFTGLAATSYAITVKDNKGCLGTTNVTIELNPINVTSYVVNANSCAGTGSIQIFRTGGVGPYTYSLDGNTYYTSNLFTGLPPGVYDCFVKDSKTCTALQSGVEVGPTGCGGRATATRTTANYSRSKNNPAIFEVQAFPNPSHQSFRLQLLSDNSQSEVTLTVTDMAGRKVYQTTGNSKHQYEFGHDLRPGVYLLQVVQGDRRKALKLVKE